MTFGKALRAIREKKGLRQIDLSLELRISNSYISCLEAGRKKPPNRERVYQLIRALNCDNEEAVWLESLAKKEQQRFIFQSIGRDHEEIVFIETLHKMWECDTLRSHLVRDLSHLLNG